MYKLENLKNILYSEKEHQSYCNYEDRAKGCKELVIGRERKNSLYLTIVEYDYFGEMKVQGQQKYENF